MNEDWDNLILLDACRYDIFDQVNYLEGDLEHRISKASQSEEFCEDIYEELRESFDLVITVADHGELLGEHGFWDHQYGVFPELTRIPLVIDDGSSEGAVEEMVSLLDVHATVLAAAGRNGAAEASRGIDILNCEALTEREQPHLTSYHGISEQTYENLVSEGFDADRLNVDLHGLGFRRRLLVPNL